MIRILTGNLAELASYVSNYDTAFNCYGSNWGDGCGEGADEACHPYILGLSGGFPGLTLLSHPYD